ncbi:ATP-binding protein [Nocardioides sp.]|uniref:ATP-binding protein n=1 Tax=Nocardioides sp. TaxID=35761 RepID=UPI002C665C5B|nr:ATP-binding protein [Nocardioides sp.]HSX67044.1 ATP-binding protein [Nocardioides sp.]
MTAAEQLVAELRKFGAEATSVEAKQAAGGLPRSVRETLSAFSNTPGGGTIILGVHESAGFAVTGLDDPSKIMADLATMCREEMSPPLVPQLEIAEVEGRAVVVADIAELPKSQKPCYIKAVGKERGSYIRIGESDRRLTSEEVQQIVADRGQPQFDHEVVLEASVDDLDAGALASFVARCRGNNPRIFADEPADVILRMTKVVSKGSDGLEHPTVAGLLALGRYPQQFFPQLNVTFVHYPTTSGESTKGGVRFLDNVSLAGSIPVMAADALAVIRRNMSRRAMITGEGRRDMWEYPPEALREAVVNALVHRDLSPGSRGIQVQIEMYPDRLRIMNPGGLFGAVDIERLGEEGRSSARNSLLMKLLEDVEVPDEDRTVCENRGSGIRAMLAALRHAGMSPPRFKDTTTAFEVLLPNHTLLDDETVAWLQLLGLEGLRDTQSTALALMRRGDVLDNASYRAATGITDSRVATFELQDLVARELVTQTGTHSGARYTLSEYAANIHSGSRRARPNRRRQVLDLLGLHTELSKAEISELLSLNPKTAEHWLRTLKAEGSVEPTEPGRGSKHTKYRLSAKALQSSLFEDSED